MHFPLPRTSPTTRRRGFSLVELSVVIAIVSVVSVFGLEAAANFINRSAGTLTKERLAMVDDATANFFKVYGRLPCPSVRTLSPVPPSNYGLEDCTITVLTSTTVGGGLMSGAVPYRTLNLPYNLSLDGFGNKLDYVVTKNLTASGGSTTVFNAFASVGTTAQTGMGGIEVRTGVLEEPCSTTKCQVLANPAGSPPDGAAYLILSHGADRRGAVSSKGTTLESCIPTAATFGQRVDTQNCVNGASGVRTNMTPATIAYNVFYDNRYNAGLNLVNYFDDYVIWRPKSKL